MLSLIPCSEQCVHQADGYCNLNKIDKIPKSSSEHQGGCIYFETNVKNKKQELSNDLS